MSDPWYDNVSKWVAEYGDKVNDFNRTYDIWQHTSKGAIDGINGNVDMNVMYNNIFSSEQTPLVKSNEQLADEVINGKWGNGADRKNRLTAAGYNYEAVQTIVNERLRKSSLKSLDEIAREVVRGKWGNGSERVKRLTAAGYDAKAVQSRVNNLMKKG